MGMHVLQASEAVHSDSQQDHCISYIHIKIIFRSIEEFLPRLSTIYTTPNIENRKSAANPPTSPVKSSPTPWTRAMSKHPCQQH